MSQVEVLRKTSWHYGQGNMGQGGLSGQVTLCRWNGIAFCVRENTNGVDSFLISSDERWGDKIGNKPTRARQVLELYAPESHWQEIRAVVHESDGLKRYVKANKNFDRRWIINAFKQQTPCYEKGKN